MEKYRKIISRFLNKRILIIGDLMLDKYVFGIVERISPEAPIPIVAVKKEKFVPGGAANVAANVSTLGGNPILIGVTGKDHNELQLKEQLKKMDIDYSNILSSSEYSTIVKIRIIGHNQQLLRIDYENHLKTTLKINSLLIEKIKNITDIDAIIISDYAKGCITKEIMDEVKKYSQKYNIPLIIDPKPKHKDLYYNAFLITPNTKEAEEMSGIKIFGEDDYIKAGAVLREKFDSNIVLTAGENGMYLFERSKEPLHIKTFAREVSDVSGAGDTVVATLSLALSSGASIYESSIISNYAAGITVEKLGTAQVGLEELNNLFEKRNIERII